MIARAIVCGMLLVLPACQIPKIRQAEQGPGLPASFNGAASPDNSAQLTVEQFYTDPVLLSLIHQGLTGNRELKALNEEVQIARNEILSRSGPYLPIVGLRGGAGLNKPSLFTPEGAVERNVEYLPGRHFPDPLPDFLLGLNLFWQLDIWRELRNARDAAAKRYLAAVERRNDFVTRMVADIAENYFTLMALDRRLETLNQTIALQERSLEIAESRVQGARGNALAVQRFLAEVRKNQSERMIIRQEIIEAENRINFRANRFPQPVERMTAGFLDLTIHALSMGVPAQLLVYRPDIRQAERDLEAAGLDVKVARAHFFPRLDLIAGVGYQAFNPKYLFATPDALVANVAGDLTAPLINKKGIQAEYLSANARQLESVYNYQRVILNAFTEVVNRLSMVENYRRSIEIKKEQLEALVRSVEIAGTLFQNARIEYIDVLIAQRDLMDARMVLIETKRRQLSAIVNTYQALGGGYLSAIPYCNAPEPLPRVGTKALGPQPSPPPPPVPPSSQDTNRFRAPMTTFVPPPAGAPAEKPAPAVAAATGVPPSAPLTPTAPAAIAVPAVPTAPAVSADAAPPDAAAAAKKPASNDSLLPDWKVSTPVPIPAPAPPAPTPDPGSASTPALPTVSPPPVVRDRFDGGTR